MHYCHYDVSSQLIFMDVSFAVLYCLKYSSTQHQLRFVIRGAFFTTLMLPLFPPASRHNQISNECEENNPSSDIRSHMQSRASIWKALIWYYGLILWDTGSVYCRAIDIRLPQRRVIILFFFSYFKTHVFIPFNRIVRFLPYTFKIIKK